MLITSLNILTTLEEQNPSNIALEFWQLIITWVFIGIGIFFTLLCLCNTIFLLYHVIRNNNEQNPENLAQHNNSITSICWSYLWIFLALAGLSALLTIGYAFITKANGAIQIPEIPENVN